MDMVERREGRMFEELSRLRCDLDQARQFLDLAGVILVAIDTNERVTFLNATGCELLGCSGLDVIGRNWFDTFIPERNREAVRAVFHQLIAGGADAGASYDNPVLIAGGEERLVAWRNRLLRDAAGRVVGTLSSGEDVSERRAKDSALEESQATLRAVIESLPIEFFALDSGGRYILQNSWCRQSWGDLLGKKPEEVAPDAKARDRWLESNRRCFAGHVVDGEVEVQRQGRTLFVHHILAPVVRGSEIGGIVGIGIDVTRRRLAEDALRRHAAILEAVSLAANQFLHSSDWEHVIQEVLGRLGQAAGASRAYLFENFARDGGELCTRQRSEWTAAGIEPQIGDAEMQSLSFKEAGLTNIVEFLSKGETLVLQTADLKEPAYTLMARQNIVTLLLVPVDVGGSWWGFMGFDECTGPRQWSAPEKHALQAAASTLGGAIKRRAAERALGESERNFRTLVERANDGITIGVEGGVIVYANRAASVLTGYPVPELLGARLSRLVPAEEEAKVVGNFSRRLRGEMVPTQYETLALRRDGSVLPIELNSAPTEWRGQPAALCFIRDISERRRAEERIQASLREKELLLKEILHRVKNNLQVVSGLVEVLADTFTDPQHRRLLRDLQQRLTSMALVHEKLYAAEGAQPVETAEYVRSLVQHLVESFGFGSNVPRAEVKVDDVSLGIETAIPCGLIIAELASNSFKHAFPAGWEGEARVVTIQLRAAGERHVLLAVDDNGVGLPAGIDLDAARTLGLQLVTALVWQLGGSVRVDRSTGTRVEVVFPLPAGNH